MATPRRTASELPDAVRDAVERTVQSTIGSAQLTRGRAQEAVDDVVKGAEERAGAVREAVRGALGERRPVTQEDLRDLTRELRAISRRLDAIEDRLPPARAKGRAKASAPAKAGKGRGSSSAKKKPSR